MQTLEAFRRGDGAHRGLSDWYKENKEALKAALDAGAPFDTGWYSSKHAIASARIWSDDGIKIKVQAFITDDFDTPGTSISETDNWTLESVAKTVDSALDAADIDRADNEIYEGFSIHDSTGAWIETYILNINGEYEDPPGDYYYWWGWQHERKDDVGMPDPRIPKDAIAAFEDYVDALDRPDELTVSGWTIRPWKD